MTKPPTERLAEREFASDDAHEQFYDLLAGVASDRPLPAAERTTDEGRGEEAA